MHIEYLGGTDPDVAVIGGMHGDEPCGPDAIERFLESDPTVERPVALVIANERALSAGTRYIDEDLNRAFSNAGNRATHESRLAARIEAEIGHCETLSLHSTQSWERPFALVDGVDAYVWRICPRLSVEAVVDIGTYSEGRLFEAVPDTVEVECGYQGSAQAVDNAVTILEEFLGTTGVCPEGKRTPQTNLAVYRLLHPLSKPAANSYDVFASNFERVEAGEPFAVADGAELLADESFYPVLLSPNGYDDQFGYAAEGLGTLD